MTDIETYLSDILSKRFNLEVDDLISDVEDYLTIVDAIKEALYILDFSNYVIDAKEMYSNCGYGMICLSWRTTEGLHIKTYRWRNRICQ